VDNWKDNVIFVLVEPEHAGNIGAAARAMKNMGFGRLSLVRPKTEVGEEAGWFAHGALDVLESAGAFDDLGDALSEASLVVGTTRRKGRRRGLFVPIEEAAARIKGFASGGGRAAVLFGGERQGLLNEHLEHCAFAFSIPTAAAQPSLNVAQAVLIAAYEVSRAGLPRAKKKAASGVISHGELELLLGRFDEALDLLGYGGKGGDVDVQKRLRANLARVFGRAGLTPGEAASFQGLCSQIEKKLKGGR